MTLHFIVQSFTDLSLPTTAKITDCLKSIGIESVCGSSGIPHPSRLLSAGLPDKSSAW